MREYETLRREILNLIEEYNEILCSQLGIGFGKIAWLIQDRIDEMNSQGITAIYYIGPSWHKPVDYRFMVYEGPWGALNVTS